MHTRILIIIYCLVIVYIMLCNLFASLLNLMTKKVLKIEESIELKVAKRQTCECMQHIDETLKSVPNIQEI